MVRLAPVCTLFPYTTLFRSPHGETLPDDRAGTEEADSGHDLRRDTGRVDPYRGAEDRKSTRLNSSHRCISYAVFCLKKKRDRGPGRPGTAAPAKQVDICPTV